MRVTTWIVMGLAKSVPFWREYTTREEAMRDALAVAQSQCLSTNWMISGGTVAANHVRVVEQVTRDGVLVLYQDVEIETKPEWIYKPGV